MYTKRLGKTWEGSSLLTSIIDTLTEINSLLAKSLAHWRYYSTYPTIQTASQAEHHIKPEIDIYTANLGQKNNKYNGPQNTTKPKIYFDETFWTFFCQNYIYI